MNDKRGSVQLFKFHCYISELEQQCTMRILFLVFALFAFGWTTAQTNLVLNPGFEDTLHLTPYQNYGAIYPLCRHWINPNNGSCDYFSALADELQWQTTNVIYYNSSTEVLTTLSPHSGVAMIGMINFQLESNLRETCLGELSSPLEEGVDYCISVWMRQAEISGLKSCEFTVGFDSVPLTSSNNGEVIPISHQFFLDIDQIDSIDWNQVHFHYSASGGEKYIYLGTNLPEQNFTCVQDYNITSWLWNTSYVLIDDVSVVEGADCTVNIQENESKDAATIDLKHLLLDASYSEYDFIVYDGLGRILFMGNQSAIQSKMRGFSGDDGLYVIVGYNEQQVIRLKYLVVR